MFSPLFSRAEVGGAVCVLYILGAWRGILSCVGIYGSQWLVPQCLSPTASPLYHFEAGCLTKTEALYFLLDCPTVRPEIYLPTNPRAGVIGAHSHACEVWALPYYPHRAGSARCTQPPPAFLWVLGIGSWVFMLTPNVLGSWVFCKHFTHRAVSVALHCSL